MLINNIILRNFRNYVDCEVCFSAPVNLIIGGNAQGKTSLLEAIYFLCTAESHRATRDSELIRHNESGFYLRGYLQNGDADVVSLEATKRARGQFKLKRNGVLQTKRSEWIGQFNAVLFSPESLTLVKGAPTERRRFLDMLISQVDKRYLKNLQQYRLVLRQRNALIKQIRAAFGDAVQLDAWDKLLATHGGAIIRRRLDIFHKLTGYAVQSHKKLTGGLETLVLTYRSSADVSASESETEISTHLHEMLNASRGADLQRGTTLVGPHRDDFLIELENASGKHPLNLGTGSCDESEAEDVEADGSEYGETETEYFREGARVYGSQGQQRTIALALKLAELELIRAVTGRDPIVLLDDVTSELDDNRTEYLLNVLQNLSAQTFITATHAEPLVNYLNHPNVLRVENADVTRGSQTSESS